MKNKRLYPAVRRVLFVLIILICHIFQFTLIPRTGLSFPVLLLLPAGIAISMAEKEFSAVLYGILTGALWDLSSPVTDGLWTLIFPVFFLFTCLLTHYTLRNTLLTSLIFNLTATLIYLFVVALYELDTINSQLLGAVFMSRQLPVIVTTLAISIPEYLFIKRLSAKFHPDKITY